MVRLGGAVSLRLSYPFTKWLIKRCPRVRSHRIRLRMSYSLSSAIFILPFLFIHSSTKLCRFSKSKNQRYAIYSSLSTKIAKQRYSCKMGYWTASTDWPSIKSVPDPVKALIELFFSLADDNSSSAGDRMADEVFTFDAILAGHSNIAGTESESFLVLFYYLIKT